MAALLLAKPKMETHRGLEVGNQPAIGVSTRIDEGHQAGSMGEEPPNVIQTQFAYPSIAVQIVEDILAILDQVLMEVHPVTGIAREWFGHEGR